jgi:hypothetical protein
MTRTPRKNACDMIDLITSFEKDYSKEYILGEIKTALAAVVEGSTNGTMTDMSCSFYLLLK